MFSKTVIAPYPSDIIKSEYAKSHDIGNGRNTKRKMNTKRPIAIAINNRAFPEYNKGLAFFKYRITLQR